VEALVALTVNVEELPAVMDIGFATRFTVGALVAVTVIVDAAVVVPPSPFAVAVYVVVVVGVTGTVPPSAASVYELPSLPDTVTEFALYAVTLSVDVLPFRIATGLAEMSTIGAGGSAPGIEFWQPVAIISSDRQDKSATGRNRNQGNSIFIFMSSFP
jgi:hypothetical protein